MSSSSDSPIVIACPQCNAKLKASAATAGSRIDCPKCNAKVLVPGVSTAASSKSEDDAWFSLEPVSDKRRSVFDDDLPDLAPLTQPPAAQANSRSEQALQDALGAQEDLFEDPVDTRTPTAPVAHHAAGAAKPKPADREYSISCKVCNTRLLVRESRAGTQVKCPDCHSMVVVPPPPVRESAAKKPAAEVKIDELESAVQLAPVEGSNSRIVSGGSINTKEMLSKASKDLERERHEIETVSGAFDSKEWLSRTFGFCSDLRLLAALAILGLAFSVAYYLFALIPFSGEAAIFSILQRFREDLLFAFTSLLQLALFICAVAVIPKAANREKKIEPWPFFKNISEYFGPACVGFVFFLATNLLANLLSGGLAIVKIPVLLRDAFADVLQWGSLPIIYLSMLELRSHMKPFSRSIFHSLSAKPDAWGAMYMQTGIAWVLYFVLYQMGIVGGAGQMAFAGFVFPWFICFVANQYGVLAGRISDVTELGYEGVFTDSE